MITIVGSLNCDFVTYVNKVPGAGETIQGDLFELHLGGKGLNEAIASSRLSPPDQETEREVRMWGKIGNDLYGRQMLQALTEAGVNTDLVDIVREDNVSSGTATILVETAQGGENRIVIVSGANGYLKPSDLEYAKHFANSRGKDDYVILQNEYPDPLKTIDWLSTNQPDVQIAYNPSPFKPEWITAEVLSKVSYLFLNLGEAVEVYKTLFEDPEFLLDESKLSKNTIVDRAIKLSNQLHTELKGATNLIITLGGNGCIFTNSNGEPQYQESVKIDKEDIVDTTGAGDTFLGGVISSLHSGKKIDEAVKFASVASGLAIQVKGAVESIPLYDTVIQASGKYNVKL